MCAILLIAFLRLGVPAASPKASKSRTSPLSRADFDGETPREAGKAYLSLRAKSYVERGSERDYQMYDFNLVETGGVGISLKSVEIYADGGDGDRYGLYTQADMAASGQSTDLPPYGAFNFTGGFPLGLYDFVGIIVHGVDDSGAALSFTGSVTF